MACTMNWRIFSCRERGPRTTDDPSMESVFATSDTQPRDVLRLVAASRPIARNDAKFGSTSCMHPSQDRGCLGRILCNLEASHSYTPRSSGHQASPPRSSRPSTLSKPLASSENLYYNCSGTIAALKETRTSKASAMSIVVCGSCNVDLVMRCKRAPAAGETITGLPDGFHTGIGGKGLNQAGACALQSRGKVSMVACVGDDAYGRQCLDAMREQGIDDAAVTTVEGCATGVALIVVEEDTGDNRIVLSTGANGRLSPELVQKAESVFASAAVSVFQLEVPLATVRAGLRLSASVGNRTILNPAPAIELDDELLGDVAILVPNETEASILTGAQVTDHETARQAAQQLLGRGVKEAVIVTLGSQGCSVTTKEGSFSLPAEKVKVVDTTAAGDSFIGGLAAQLAEGNNLKTAVHYGQRVAAITVTRRGALGSIPSRQEVEASL